MASGMEIHITMPRRRAVATLHSGQAKKYGLGYDAGDYECFVLFTSQETDGDDIAPVFVCEFLNGCVGNIYTERVSFVDTDDEGVIV